jgi:integrase
MLMPRIVRMSWEPSRRRWWKVITGKRYVVSISQLKKLGYLPTASPESKESSYQAANAWLADQLKATPSTPFAEMISLLEARRAWADQHGHDTSGLDQMLTLARGMAKDGWLDRYKPEYTDSELANAMTTLAGVEPFKHMAHLSSDSDKSVSFWVDKYLELRRAEAKEDIIATRTVDNIKLYLTQFATWVGSELSTITATRLVEYYKHLLAQPLANPSRKTRYSYARAFIEWLQEQKLIESFSTKSRRYTFGSDREEVQTLPVETVRGIIDKAQGILTLHLLLMANTGMTQRDISDLEIKEYDGTYITRRRSKMKRKGTRVVSWRLWSTTKKLLDKYKQTSGEALLLTSTGNRWVGSGRSDNIRTLYRGLDIPIPLKRLRQTSGDMIQKKFGKDIADHFLGHGQDPVDAGYFSRRQKDLDDAVIWLGTQYGY